MSEFFDELRTEFVRVLNDKLGVSEQTAAMLWAEIKQKPFQVHACTSVYVGKTDPSRREKVLAEFNGRNRHEVCQRHGISKAQFYNYLKGG